MTADSNQLCGIGSIEERNRCSENSGSEWIFDIHNYHGHSFKYFIKEDNITAVHNVRCDVSWLLGQTLFSGAILQRVFICLGEEDFETARKYVLFEFAAR